MRRLILPVIMAAAGVFATSCERKSDFITNTSPFLSEYVATPPGNHYATAERARSFALRHQMKVHYVPGHFEPNEFSISLTRDDLNIVTDNVLLGDRTLVNAYALGKPSSKQREVVDEFMCSVMMHDCPDHGRLAVKADKSARTIDP
jgi:hypothetical protein